MGEIVRFGVSLDGALLKRFDTLIRKMGYGNRSKAIADLVRERLVEREWAGGEEVVGTITMIYDHHQRELTARLTDIQHRHHDAVLSSQHIHLDHRNCLEVVIVRGAPREIRKLAEGMKACRGVKHLQLTMSSTGKEIG